MEELTATVRQNAAHARQASELAPPRRRASDGNLVMQQVVDTMQAIEASSKRIGDITGVIDGIAFQTNILALNAAVEAARAGEQGAASPWWPAKCACWPSVPPQPRRRSRN
jgi:methyl-accepting chemotaxis protein